MNGCHLNDNESRRSGFERRQYHYSVDAPENRSDEKWKSEAE
jgi:hypothetical protein